jgi:hypothetical protein
MGGDYPGAPAFRGPTGLAGRVRMPACENCNCINDKDVYPMRMISAALAALCLCAAPALAVTPEQDVDRYVQIFNGDDAKAQNESVETFAWKGLSDPRLFDVIEKRVLAEHAAARGNRDDKNRVARYIRALGFSGQAKYKPTITSFLQDPVYQRYAQDALENVETYGKWNALISDRTKFNPRISDDANRVINMLRADDMMLKRVGAKRVYFGQREPEVVAVLAEQVKTHYTNQDRQYADVVAWLVKGLGSAKDPQYRPLLEEVVAAWGQNGKLGTHARQALEAYSK